MAASPARRLALDILTQIESSRRTLADRLARADVEALDARERGFLHELLMGTLRRRGALDYVIQPLLDRPLASLDPPLPDALRLGAYQLLHLRVPARASVSEAVELVRERRPQAAGYVNAVLRRVARGDLRAFPDPAAEPLAWLTSAGSLPAWLAARWLERLGPDQALARARVFLEPAPTTARLNPRQADARERLEAAGVELVPRALDGAFEVASGDPLPWAAAGLLYLQDQGSQLVARLAAEGGAPVLDACAAPGGKATLIADLLGDGALVVAAEAAARRLGVMARLVARWGAPNVGIVGADGLRPPFRARFRSVLVDAPCSGLGTLSRHPDLRWRTRVEAIARHAQRQSELLRSLAPLVAPGGRLVFATCSLEREENEDVVATLLGEQPHFEPAPAPDWARPFRDGRFLRTLPERDGGDGFFAAVLRRSR